MARDFLGAQAAWTASDVIPQDRLGDAVYFHAQAFFARDDLFFDESLLVEFGEGAINLALVCGPEMPHRFMEMTQALERGDGLSVARVYADHALLTDLASIHLERQKVKGKRARDEPFCLLPSLAPLSPGCN